MSRKNQITYQKPDPPFLRRIREQVGYKEIPDVDTKVSRRSSFSRLSSLDSSKHTKSRLFIELPTIS